MTDELVNGLVDLRSAHYVFIADGTPVWLDLATELKRRTGITPSLWLGHPNHLDGAKEYFPDCEVWDERRINFGDFPRNYGDCLPRVVRQSPTYAKFELAALNSLDRNELFREIATRDRMLFLTSLGDFLWSLHSKVSVIGVVGSQAPHSPGGLLLSGMMQALGHSLLHFVQVPIAPFMIPRRGFGFEELKVDGSSTETIRQDTSGEISIFLDAWFRNASEAKIASWEHVNSSKEAELGGLRGQLRRLKYGRRHMTDLWTSYAALDVHPLAESWGRPSLLDVWRAERSRAARLDRIRQELRRRQSNSQPSRKFGVFLLHFEPEKTTMPDGGLGDSQIAMVRRARRLLPGDVELIVKEHPSQIKLATNGYLGRSTGFYREVSEIPGVRLVSEIGSDRRWLREAEVVFTVSGTVGLEAALLGAPLLYFGHPWYAGIPGTMNVAEVGNGEADEFWARLPPRAEPRDIRSAVERILTTEALRGFASPGHARRFVSDGWQERYDLEGLVSVVAKHLERGVHVD